MEVGQRPGAAQSFGTRPPRTCLCGTKQPGAVDAMLRSEQASMSQRKEQSLVGVQHGSHKQHCQAHVVLGLQLTRLAAQPTR